MALPKLRRGGGFAKNLFANPFPAPRAGSARSGRRRFVARGRCIVRGRREAPPAPLSDPCLLPAGSKRNGRCQLKLRASGSSATNSFSCTFEVTGIRIQRNKQRFLHFRSYGHQDPAQQTAFWHFRSYGHQDPARRLGGAAARGAAPLAYNAPSSRGAGAFFNSCESFGSPPMGFFSKPMHFVAGAPLR